MEKSLPAREMVRIAYQVQFRQRRIHHGLRCSDVIIVGAVGRNIVIEGVIGLGIDGLAIRFHLVDKPICQMRITGGKPGTQRDGMSQVGNSLLIEPTKIRMLAVIERKIDGPLPVLMERAGIAGDLDLGPASGKQVPLIKVHDPGTLQ